MNAHRLISYLLILLTIFVIGCDIKTTAPDVFVDPESEGYSPVTVDVFDYASDGRTMYGFLVENISGSTLYGVVIDYKVNIYSENWSTVDIGDMSPGQFIYHHSAITQFPNNVRPRWTRGSTN